MTTTLNLYDPQWLQPPQTSLPGPPLAVLAAAGVLAAVVAAANAWHLQGLRAALAQAQGSPAALQAGKAAMADPAAAAAAIAALAEAAERREATLRQWRGMGGGSDAGGPSTANANASQWFRSLSAVALQGVWLTRVHADVGGGFRLEGRAQDGVTLSSYLEHWRNEPLLAGVALQTLEMKRSEAGGASDGTASGNNAELAFVLSNLPAGRLPGQGDTVAGRPASAALASPTTTPAAGQALQGAP